MRADLPPSPSAEELARIESQLHQRLRETQEAYKAAKSEADRLYAVKDDVGGFTHPDGRSAVLSATRRENIARSAYMAALKAFNDFVLDYKLPKDLNGSAPRKDAPRITAAKNEPSADS